MVVLILLSNVVYRRLIVHVLTDKKKFLYQNDLIHDQNDFNVNKQIFIFLFYTCIVCIGTTSKINIYNGYLRRGRGGDVTKHNVEFKHKHHWQMLNRYFEKNYTCINDINLVWRGGVTINTCTTDWKKQTTHRLRKNACIRTGKKCVEVRNAYSILLFLNSNKPIWHFLSKS